MFIKIDKKKYSRKHKNMNRHQSTKTILDNLWYLQSYIEKNIIKDDDSDDDYEDSRSDDIIIEKINDYYSYGEYENCKLVIMNHNCYINATKLSNTVQKNIYEWNNLEETHDLKMELSNITKIPLSELTISIVDENLNLPMIFGLYLHPQLAPYLTVWLSTAIVFKVSSIINKFINYPLSTKIDDLKLTVSKQKYLLKNKENRIIELHNKIKTNKKILTFFESLND
jgi:hypothetical protein